ncbi:MAG: ComEC/Rec2 family competence protein [Victivallaceae bacterium]|nr:ComEC/Rec2 family competence protein [Victivallaceae bacterium]
MKWRSAAPPSGGIYFLLAGILTALLFYFDIAWAALPLAVFTVTAGTKYVPGALLPQFAAGLLLGTAALTVPGPELKPDRSHWIFNGNFRFTVTDYGGAPVGGSLVAAEMSPDNRLGGGTVLLRLPPETAPLFGDVIYAEDALLSSPGTPVRINRLLKSGRIIRHMPAQPDGFERYMCNRGIRAVANIKKVSAIEEGGGGIRRSLAVLRAKLAKNIASGMNERAAAVVNAVVLGVRQGMAPDERDDFLKSGTIHLFSVSGLHVGVAAMLAMLLLSPAPWRFRAPAMLLAVWFYTLLSGAQVPAVRAALMISCFITAKAYLHRVRPLSTLALAATLILLWSPRQLFDLGFQFSFVITGFLLLTGERVRKLSMAVNEINYFKPPEKVPRRSAAAKIVALATMLTVVYLAGMPLSLYHQEIFTPGSLPANLLIMPLTSPLFMLAFIKMIPVAGAVATIPLNFLANLLRAIAGGAAEVFSETAALSPAAWMTVAFLLALLLFIKGGNVARTVAAAAMFVWLAVIFGGRFLLADFMLIAHGGDGATVCVAASPANGAAYSLNLPGLDAAPAVRKFLASRGIRRIECAMLTPHSPAVATAAAAMTGQIAVCGKPRRVNPAGDWTSLPEKMAIWRPGPALFELKNKIAVLDYQEMKIKLETEPGGVAKVSYGENAAIELWNKLYPELYVCEYEK